ncbi:MAG: 2-oxoacid:acceptor oxidoreductase family protein [Candidatus Thorarchaeota archaeon]|nr:MAG: 2-oxoacid:acceptor oxidoreductase family protein [Candidatus Thorarchaeota archaeon]
MKSSFDIVVAGVGGQGNLVCGRILAEGAVRRNLRPVVGDTFGASRRGGAVLTHLRIGEFDMGPLIPRNQADLILGLEPLETLRAAVKFGRQDTVVIFSELKVDTADTLGGKTEYPDIDKMTEALESISGVVFRLDPKASLDKIGSSRVLNSYMIGALAGSGKTPLNPSELRGLVGETLKPKKTNISAFDAGLKCVSELMKSKGV